MYNRYVPQPDGTHRRNTIQTEPSQQRQRQPLNSPVPPPFQEQAPDPEPAHTPPPAFRAGDFLKRLIPKDLDTGDLLIIVLLLLMSADCQEEKNTALLTLALYLFM